MYLQSLEILGFKSFATKTLLTFHRGVTAIVGPNGCGKSNVLDAMRWVLGEQSAKALRGGEMADVIFSGTDAKAPLGMAEVSLTFSECEKELGLDYHDVCITRRVFRDGRSEYFLNKVPCRLRDIHQLFMDTGIGRSAYSIMEQGKIDQILSSRPEDRRAIFEEAAGITKFKGQKKEAMRKLDATEANLLRVSDIIKEVKRQIGSLQRQAAKARRFQSLATDLKTLETHHAFHQFTQLDSQRQLTETEIARLRDTVTEQEAAIETEENALSDQRHAFDEVEQRLTSARESVGGLKNQIVTAHNRVGFNRERIQEFSGLTERYRTDVAGAEEKLTIQRSQIENTDLELEQLGQTLTFEQQRLDEKSRAASSATAQRTQADREIQQIFGNISRIENRLNSLRGDAATNAAQREAADSRLHDLDSEIKVADESVQRVTTQIEELRRQLHEQQQALAARQQQVQEADAALRTAQSAHNSAEQDRTGIQRRLTEKESRLDALRQLNAEGAGLSEGTQALLRGLDNPEFFQPAIAGALAQHIEVAPEFIAPIEAALGASLQAVLMKDAMIAESAIKTLTSKNLGRATMAVRDLGIRNSDSGANTSVPEGAIAWAATKVQATGEAAELIATLLDAVLIVPTIEIALRLADNPQPAIRNPQLFVSLTGETLTHTGLLTGGKQGSNGAAVLQRKAQIAGLENEAAAIRAEIEAADQRRAQAADALEAARNALSQLREDSQEASVLLSTLRAQQGMMDRELRDATQKAANLRRERESIEQRIASAAQRIVAIETETTNATNELTTFQARHTAIKDELEILRTSEAGLSEELSELRVRVATERQRHGSLANQRQPMAIRVQELSELIAQRSRDITGYEQKVAQLTSDTAEIEAGIADLENRVTAAEAEMECAAQARVQAVTALESREASLRILRRQLQECLDQRSQHEVRQTQFQLRIENLSEHIQRRYQFDIRDFQTDSYTLATTLRDLAAKKKAPVTQDDAAYAVTGDSQDVTGGKEETPRDSDNLTSADTPPTSLESPVTSGELDWTLVESLVAEMSQRLDSMGPINIDAIQEYDELEQRYSFLEQQIADLTSAKDELLDVIGKINRTTRELFSETFEKVRVNFQEMFTELFGGGKANLVLLDESDPLESGIDIIAKPPGKQLTSISLLSGGEKTMTAVALLFSIYMVKPSPFCVLDEMDAPLDESNIVRFIKILDRFVDQSQFVVITHNKRTIAKADVLYGVTMEEHGISKLVSVKFAKREDSTERTDIIGTDNPGADQHVPSVAQAFGKSEDLHSEKAG